MDIDRLRSAIVARLDRAPQLRLQLADVHGERWWVTDKRLDLREHVVRCDDGRPADDTSLRATVARLFEERLDRSRPLWRIDVVPQLAGGGSALIWRIHHALADGSTAMRLAGAALWDIAPGPPPRVARPAEPVSRRRLGSLLAVAREAPQPWRRSPFDGDIGARREVAFAAVELDGLRRLARANDGATVNDAVLAVVAGGLRRWLEGQHGHLGSVRVKVPVSLHGDEDGELGNRDSFFCLDLPLGIADPLERLSAIRRATRMRKQGHDAQQLDALMRQLARVPRLRQFAERALSHPRSFALNVSNVPGPRQPVHVLGLRAREVYSLAEIREHHALRIAVVSYAGNLNLGFTADPTLLPDVDRLAGDMRDEAVSLLARLSYV